MDSIPTVPSLHAVDGNYPPTYLVISTWHPMYPRGLVVRRGRHHTVLDCTCRAFPFAGLRRPLDSSFHILHPSTSPSSHKNPSPVVAVSQPIPLLRARAAAVLPGRSWCFCLFLPSGSCIVVDSVPLFLPDVAEARYVVTNHSVPVLFQPVLLHVFKSWEPDRTASHANSNPPPPPALEIHLSNSPIYIFPFTGSISRYFFLGAISDHTTSISVEHGRLNTIPVTSHPPSSGPG